MMSEIGAIATASEALFTSNQTLEALVETGLVGERLGIAVAKTEAGPLGVAFAIAELGAPAANITRLHFNEEAQRVYQNI